MLPLRWVNVTDSGASRSRATSMPPRYDVRIAANAAAESPTQRVYASLPRIYDAEKKLAAAKELAVAHSRLRWRRARRACAASCAGPSPGGTKLAAVDALPMPSLPPWIAAISPAGTTENLAQVRVIFAKPLVPLTALSGPGPRDVLDHVRIAPALRGRFAVLTPRMIAFVPEQALPIGTRVKITLTAGLHDLDGDRLDGDLAWTFETAPLEITSMPELNAAGDDSTPPPVDVLPKLAVTANAAVDPQSLAEHASLVGGGDTVTLTASLETQPTPDSAGMQANSSTRRSTRGSTISNRPARCGGVPPTNRNRRGRRAPRRQFADAAQLRRQRAYVRHAHGGSDPQRESG